ncbi:MULTISPECIES: hypothetical protein [Shouchella]|jgi:hypothetical protein|uniref:Uncharacterized protein n=4 Tax=Shouchella TaxID=2893057 RepID=Q5WI87_SHOC1|nr:MULTISPECIES: hypothetical protein [Shouchella]MCM3314007.1 hypothetical protein [Psychrobacillus sp. MER TA 17]KKI88053.1 hypothetical protein WZ76_01170 [Shouchella clausii]MCM3378825.1 hypothetical protein [Shouchella rhizosphaerae]PAD18598.1 hypothetical protein CHH73_04870 [Shouchella clausii]PAD45036.1 hypothetical protein CHI09_19715 [Shouchella clausii]
MLAQKTMWLGMVLVLIVLTVFGVAMMGSVLGSKPKELPVALVILSYVKNSTNETVISLETILQTI